MPDHIHIKIDDTHYLYARYRTTRERALANREKSLVVFIHGFPGDHTAHDDIFGGLEHVLLDVGFHTLRFDFLGCGKSSGEASDFSLRSAKISFQAVHDWAAENGYEELIYVSEGLGSTLGVINMGLNVTCQVMLWPGLDPQYLAQQTFQPTQIKGLVDVNLNPMLKDVSMPVIIMHGSADDKYPVDHLNIARKHMSSKRIEITTFHGGGHGLPRPSDRNAMFFHVTEFLEKFA